MGLRTQSPGSGVVIRGSVHLVSEGLVPWVLGAVRLRGGWILVFSYCLRCLGY